MVSTLNWWPRNSNQGWVPGSVQLWTKKNPTEATAKYQVPRQM